MTAALTPIMPKLRRILYDPDLLLRQPVQLIHQPVDLPIGRDDLALVYGLLLVRDRGGQLAVQIQHGLDQRDHPVVVRDVGRVGEVDGADGELFDVLTFSSGSTHLEKVVLI